MKKTYFKIIEMCGQCPNIIVDDNEHQERWGKCWCEEVNEEVKKETMHLLCPLPLTKANAKLTAEVEQLEDCHQKILNWISAYPLEVFPEPDFEAVRVALASKGIKLDAVSASNMRHVLKGIKELIDKAMER